MLESVWRLSDEGEKIHQISDFKNNIDLKSFGKDFTEFCLKLLPLVQRDPASERMILVKINIDEKGLVTNYQLLNPSESKFDEALEIFLKSKIYYPKRNIQYKFNSYRVDGKKVKCEFIIPFQFNTNKFYYSGSNYNWNNYQLHQLQMDMFNQRQTMMQMHMQNSMKNVQIPH